MSICGLGAPELIVLGIVLVIIFSASRMGALGNAIGKFVYSFKKASSGEDTIDVSARRIGGGRKDASEPVDAEIIEAPKKNS
jgi:sec-independent protein translocase protein TatA